MDLWTATMGSSKIDGGRAGKREMSIVISRTEKRSLRKHCTTASASLTPDIIYEILLRLPARSVLKFRCVCKLFNQLSTTKEFILAHTQQSRHNPQLLPTLLALSLRTEATALYILHGKTQHNIETIGLNYIPFLPRKNHYNECVASCDGLLCFSRYKSGQAYTILSSFIILNPLTKRSSLIPLPVSGTFVVLSFYYHMHSSTYRLLLMRLVPSECTTRCIQYNVFTIGQDTLVTVNNSAPYDVDYYDHQAIPKLIKNTWYCLVGREEWQESYAALLVFNTETEQFTHVLLPDDHFIYDEYSERVELLEIDGKLCICQIHILEGRPYFHLDLWILKDEVEGIWIKKEKVNIEILRGPQENYNIVTSVFYHFYHHYYLLLVKSEDGKNDITSPGKVFTFFYLEGDNSIEKMPDHGSRASSSLTFRETLATVAIHPQCDEATYLPPQRPKRRKYNQ